MRSSLQGIAGCILQDQGPNLTFSRIPSTKARNWGFWEERERAEGKGGKGQKRQKRVFFFFGLFSLYFSFDLILMTYFLFIHRI